jgi:hypothetical protein
MVDTRVPLKSRRGTVAAAFQGIAKILAFYSLALVEEATVVARLKNVLSKMMLIAIARIGPNLRAT